MWMIARSRGICSDGGKGIEGKGKGRMVMGGDRGGKAGLAMMTLV